MTDHHRASPTSPRHSWSLDSSHEGLWSVDACPHFSGTKQARFLGVTFMFTLVFKQVLVMLFRRAPHLAEALEVVAQHALVRVVVQA